MSKKNRIATYIKTAIEEMELAEQMSEPINEADDFGKNLNGMTIFRACSMSIQCITDHFFYLCLSRRLFKTNNYGS